MSTKLTFNKATLLIAFFIVCVNGFAQRSIYEIKYKFYEKGQDGGQQLGQEYSSLVFYYDLNSASNVMRTRYYDARDGWVVVEQKIKMSLTSDGNKNYWTLAGQDAKFITPVSNGAQYNPDNIVLSKKPSETYYTADYVFDNAGNKGVITSFKVLNKADVDNNYLAIYKWSWKQSNTTANNDLNNSTLHLILVANSNDPALGNGFNANQQNIKSLFKEVAATCNMQLDIVEVDGYKFGRENISAAINNVVVSANDVIVFYYSGHGFRFPNQKTDWPQLDLRTTVSDNINTNTLNLGSDVYMPLTNKNPRLLMVIGECCNVNFGAGTPFIRNPAALPLGATIMNSSTVKNLFSQRGKILVATSKPFESSWYYQDTGGIFGSNFTSTFLADVGFTSSNTNISWETIFNDAIQYTIEKTEAKANGTQPQHPIHYYELK